MNKRWQYLGVGWWKERWQKVDRFRISFEGELVRLLKNWMWAGRGNSGTKDSI